MKFKSVPFKLFVFGFLLYLPSFANQFVFDDFFYFLNNTYLGDLSLIPKLFTSNNLEGAGILGNYYRPLSAVTLSIDKMIWGDFAFGYHLTNTWMHALAGAVLYLLCRELSFKKWPAIWIALMFLSHPVQVQAVVYMASRGDPQYALFLLSSLWLWTKAQKKNAFKTKKQHLQALVGVVLLYLSAILSKEIAVAGIGLYILIWWQQHKWVTSPRKIIEQLRKNSLITATLSALIITVTGYLMLRFTLLNFTDFQTGDHLPQEYVSSLFVRLMTFGQVFWRYLGMILLPHPLYFERVSQILTQINLWFVAMATTMIASFWVAKKELTLNKTAWIFFGFWWFLGMLTPLSGIFPVNGLLYENWLYLPLIGVSILAIQVLSLMKIDLKQNKLLIGIVAILSFLTIKQIQVWKDPITFYSYNLEHNPTARIYLNLGNEYAQRGQFDQALPHIQKAIELKPEFAQAYMNRGLIYERQNQPDLAIKDLEKANQIAPTFYDNRKQLIRIYLESGQQDKALEHSLILEEQTPQDWTVLVMLGRIYTEKGDPETANQYFEQALTISDNSDQVKTLINQVKSK